MWVGAYHELWDNDEVFFFFFCLELRSNIVMGRVILMRHTERRAPPMFGQGMDGTLGWYCTALMKLSMSVTLPLGPHLLGFLPLFFVVCTCTSTSTLKQNPKRIYFLHIAGVPRSSRRYAHWASHCQLIIYQILNFCWAQIYSSTRFHSSTVVPERVTRSLSEIWLRKSQNIANGNNYHGY